MTKNLEGTKMGFLNSLLGNASDVNISEVAEERAPIIGDTESLQYVFRVIRDMYVFTNKRLILIDKQGMTGRKVDYHSIPFDSLPRYYPI